MVTTQKRLYNPGGNLIAASTASSLSITLRSNTPFGLFFAGLDRLAACKEKCSPGNRPCCMSLSSISSTDSR